MDKNCGNCKYAEGMCEICDQCITQMVETKDKNYPLWEEQE